MRVVSINGLDVTVGLSWRALSGLTSERKEISSLSKDLGSSYGVITRSDYVTAVGFSTRAFTAPSAAGWLASAAGSRSLILAENIGSDEVWLCIIRDGAPMAGFDRVCKKSEVMDLLSDFIASGGYEFISNLDDIPKAVNSDFNQMVSGIKPIYIERVSGLGRGVYIAAAGVAITAVILFSYVTRQQIEKTNNIGQRKAAANASAVKNDQMAREAARLEVIRLARASATTLLSLPSPVDQVLSWRQVIDGIPLLSDGWSVSKYNCTVKQCVATWSRTPYGTIEGALEGFRKYGWTIDKWTADEILVSYEVKSVPRNPRLDSTPNNTTFNPSLISEIQRVKLAEVLGDIKETSSTVSIAAPFASASAPATETPKSPEDYTSELFRIVDMSFSGVNIYEIKDLADILNYENIALTSVQMNINVDQFTWKIEGKYVVK